MNILELFKGLADENRLRILNVILQYNACVCELETILELNQANVSRHLSVLKSSKVLVGNKEAKWIHYSLSEDLQDETELMHFLKHNLATLDSCQKDNIRLKCYLASEFSSEDIRCNREGVKHYLADE